LITWVVYNYFVYVMCNKIILISSVLKMEIFSKIK
jgi:hypothetical protein